MEMVIPPCHWQGNSHVNGSVFTLLYNLRGKESISIGRYFPVFVERNHCHGNDRCFGSLAFISPEVKGFRRCC